MHHIQQSVATLIPPLVDVRSGDYDVNAWERERPSRTAAKTATIPSTHTHHSLPAAFISELLHLLPWWLTSLFLSPEYLKIKAVTVSVRLSSCALHWKQWEWSLDCRKASWGSWTVDQHPIMIYSASWQTMSWSLTNWDISAIPWACERTCFSSWSVLSHSRSKNWRVWESKLTVEDKLLSE